MLRLQRSARIVRQAADPVIVELLFDDGFGAAPQTAPWPKRITIEAGELALTIGHATRVLGPGETVLIPAGQPHGYANRARGSGKASLRMRLETPDSAYVALLDALAALPGVPDWASVRALYEQFGHRFLFD